MNDPRTDTNKEDNEGITPLYRSIMNDNSTSVKLLFEDPRCEFDGDNIDFIFNKACANGDIHIIKLLLSDDRCDINQVDERGRTLFELACINGIDDIVKYMLKNCDDIVIPEDTSRFSKRTMKLIAKYHLKKG